MIQIHCTNCQATLEIDDAFAGGVCRCQHCGTIQTVPAHLKGNAPNIPAGVAIAGQQQPTYQTGRGGGTGLDELSDAVVSSGLARSGLRTKGQGQARHGGSAGAGAASSTAGVDYATPQQQKKSPVLWIVLGAIGAGLLLLIALGAYFFVSKSSPTPSTPTITRGGDDDNIVVPKTPNFCGIDLSKSTGVVYVLDRGSASGDLLDTLKAATYRSIESLGSSKKFAVVFWELGNEPIVAYPAKGLAEATDANIDAANRAFEDVVAHGRSDPATAVKDAAARGASDMIFVTAKGDDLDDSVISLIDTAFAGKKVHAFGIGEDFGQALKTIAQKHNGTYQLLRKKQLDAFSRSK